MSKERLRRAHGDSSGEPFSAALANELAQGTTREELVDRLVGEGWSVGNASHFVNYVEAASTLASCLYVREGQAEVAEEPYEDSRVPWLDTRASSGWSLPGGGIGGLVRNLGGLLHRSDGSSGSRRRRPRAAR